MYWEQYDENVYWCLGVKAGCLAQTRDWTITRLNETLLLSLGILKLSLTSQKNLWPRTSPFVAMYARLGQTTLLVFIIFLCSGDSSIHLIQVGSQFTTGINFFPLWVKVIFCQRNIHMMPILICLIILEDFFRSKATSACKFLKKLWYCISVRV